MKKPYPLHKNFLNSVERFPERPALEAGGDVVSYRELFDHASSIAATVQGSGPEDPNGLVAVFGYRSVTAFAGVLGALLSGHGYVPLNRTFPGERSRDMLLRSGCRCIVVDAASMEQLDVVLGGQEPGLRVIIPDSDALSGLVERWPQHHFIFRGGLAASDLWREPSELAEDILAYVLFTSGSTGQPKGVMVTQANVQAYVDWTCQRYEMLHTDRVSQTFDMTFDLSAHDMFVTWTCGACLCCPTQKELIMPGGFIKRANLSVWFSVPSTIIFMKRLGQLKPNAYPNLRLSLFCGEALPAEALASWVAAAPNSVVENLYGPTELTIACTAYRWDTDTSPSECERGVVPIGHPFAGMEALIVDTELREVEAGAEGELLMTGTQLTRGYLNDPERTARAFLVPPGRNKVFYRTGDRVRSPLPGRPITYLGRMDNQVKILGHRVELGEVEEAVRRSTGVDAVVAIAWPETSSGADGIEVFVEAEDLDRDRIGEDLRARLPSYMWPKNIYALGRFPLNSNGKYDRRELKARLENGAPKCRIESRFNAL